MKENEVTDDPVEEAGKPEPLGKQIGALLVLLVVFAAIWGLFKFLPSVGEWMGTKADEIVEPVGESDLAVAANPPEAAEEVDAPPAGEVQVVSTGALEFFRQQIIEQLGGADIVEVRHLALSDDETRMVAALNVGSSADDNTLLEVFFEKDEFGRFLSTDDSPVDRPLKLWPE